MPVSEMSRFLPHNTQKLNDLTEGVIQSQNRGALVNVPASDQYLDKALSVRQLVVHIK